MGSRLVAYVLAVGLLAAGCSSSPTSKGGATDGLGNGLDTGSSAAPVANGAIGVVAGENTWGNVLQQIGGAKVSVLSIISDPNADPHQYEGSLNDAAAVAHARLVVANGAGYDDFLNRLLGAAQRAGRTVLTVATLVEVHGSNPNPHLWYQPGYVDTAARAFEQALAAISPADAATFAANLQTFLAGEQRVVDVINQIKARYAATEIAYTERVAGYLVDAAGLKLGTPAGFAQSLEDGNDPSPVDNLNFESAITAHRIKALIYNAQVTDSITTHIKQLANSSHVPVVGMSETLPPGEKDFQTWQADQANALLAALNG